MITSIVTSKYFWGKYKSRRWFAMKARKYGISFNECLLIYSGAYRLRGLKHKPKKLKKIFSA